MSNDDFNFEPVRGLPELLPRGEQMIWQGGPQWTEVARRIYHVDKIAIYFGILIAWRIVSETQSGRGLAGAFASGAWLLVPAVAALALFGLLAWGTARSTVYTITSERIVMRIGMALPITINIPFTRIAGADLAVRSNGTGEIALTLVPGERIAYLALWPHLQWRWVAYPHPTFICIPDARHIGALLGVALAAAQSVIRVSVTEPDGDASGAGAGFVSDKQLTAAE